ncbi:FAD-dependent oxidoreductase [Undibacterium sp. Jales W-56]|uniref:NAD(P)/FAD-dependent oxidoreductase n=1 Tax=Undibacterium sp. Jales W-56 TaxID=2897325 RepID=UPI0021D04209|nr:FAD-dependent oxidoreductase [Undibacterium sp. Jales W-56]MCU6435026.1 FAD-dependent oxidoreductase [Undibacterium sp. Jales W-56]
MKIAVIGSGISGLSCAYRLSQAQYDVSLFEANDYFGGHTHTVDVTLDGQTYGVDTGFLVFNHKTYPNLVNLFEELEIETAATDMSFSVKMPIKNRSLEWAGANLDTVFAQRRNLFSPRFLGMLRDILRFNRQTTALANTVPVVDSDFQLSLGDFLDKHRYGQAFRTWYLLPMAACIWSCPTAIMMGFPLSSFVRFCHNHGLLQVNDRPRWQTVKGGARHYVEKILERIPKKYLNTPVLSVRRTAKHTVQLLTQNGAQEFDHVVLATHSDQSLAMLSDASSDERNILSAVTYQPNKAVLHTDASFLPEQKKAWSAWNYQSESGNEAKVCVHYLINQLQPLPFSTPVIVSLNPISAPAASCVLASFDYAHPVFDQKAMDAQSRLHQIQGINGIWFAGAWTGYGFHEDGLKSGLAVAEQLQKSDRPEARAA